jgi:hypothetical protein
VDQQESNKQKTQNDMPSHKNNTNNNYVFSNDLDMEPVITRSKRGTCQMLDTSWMLRMWSACGPQLPNIRNKTISNIRMGIPLLKETFT